jgi:hypothetical protein
MIIIFSKWPSPNENTVNLVRAAGAPKCTTIEFLLFDTRFFRARRKLKAELQSKLNQPRAAAAGSAEPPTQRLFRQPSITVCLSGTLSSGASWRGTLSASSSKGASEGRKSRPATTQLGSRQSAGGRDEGQALALPGSGMTFRYRSYRQSPEPSPGPIAGQAQDLHGGHECESLLL